MNKTLQKKFVKTAMTAITLLIVILLGAINIINIIMVRNDIDRTLKMIADSTDMPAETPKNFSPNDNPPPVNNDISMHDPRPHDSKDRLIPSPYFIVKTDNKENITDIDISRVTSLDTANAKKMAAKVFSDGKPEGKCDGYRYKLFNNHFNDGKILVFLDINSEIYSYLRILLISTGIGAVCWTAMLLLVIFLSKKAIRPIAESIQKQKLFITNAGHEIKTPLAIIQTNTEAMELYQGESKWSRNIKQQIKRLDVMTKNLLFLAQFDEQRGLKIKPDKFNLSSTIADTINSFKEPMNMKHINFEADISEEITLNADKDRIIQLVSVLLDNALKYANDGGTVTVNGKNLKGKTRLEFKNTVSELPDVPPETMFDRFYRGDKARTQNSGCGVGLSIAKAIAEENGGMISASYEKPNIVSFIMIF